MPLRMRLYQPESKILATKATLKCACLQLANASVCIVLTLLLEKPHLSSRKVRRRFNLFNHREVFNNANSKICYLRSLCFFLHILCFMEADSGNVEILWCKILSIQTEKPKTKDNNLYFKLK